jgi:hypothetical protein
MKRMLTLGVAASAMLLLGGSATATGRYTDPSGDSGQAPDISGVTVSSDANGQITLLVNIVNLPSPADVRTFVFLNTDEDETTGDPQTLGSEYGFVVDESDGSYGFAHWDGSKWGDTPNSTVQVFSGPSGVRILVNRSELGNTNEFELWARTRLGDVSANQADDAPDAGTYNFSVAANGPNIHGIVTQLKPTLPKAGRRFAIVVGGLKVGPDQAISVLPQPDSYSCRAKVAGRVLKGTGTGKCSWLIPKKARRKQLVVTLTLSYQGATRTFKFPFRVS